MTNPTPPTIDELVAEARELDAKATPGPWDFVMLSSGEGCQLGEEFKTPETFEDACFIAAARTLLVQLADALGNISAEKDRWASSYFQTHDIAMQEISDVKAERNTARALVTDQEDCINQLQAELLEEREARFQARAEIANLKKQGFELSGAFAEKCAELADVRLELLSMRNDRDAMCREVADVKAELSKALRPAATTTCEHDYQPVSRTWDECSKCRRRR